MFWKTFLIRNSVALLNYMCEYAHLFLCRISRLATKTNRDSNAIWLLTIGFVILKNESRYKSSILWRIVAFWSLKAEKVHFEKIKFKVFGTAFEKKNCAPLSLMHVYWRINGGFRSVFMLISILKSVWVDMITVSLWFVR